MTSLQLAVIIPVYNPPKGWAHQMIIRLCDFLQTINESSVQLVIVNDGSTNNHFMPEINEVADTFPGTIILHNEKNYGKGYTIRKAADAIHADSYMVTDVDLPYTTESMISIYNELKTGTCDIAAGNRNKDYYNQVHGFRRNLSLMLRYFIRKRLRLFADDTQCGLKGFNETGKQLFLQTKINRYLYDLEFMVKACNSKTIRLKSVPVIVRNGIVLGNMSFKILLQETGNFLRVLLFRNKL